MIIEFNTVYGQVPEQVVKDARKKIMSVIHTDKNIRKAEVTLEKDKFVITNKNKSCCIKLLYNEDNIVIHTRTENFVSAIQEAVKQLKKRVKQHGTKHKEPINA